MSVTAEAKQTAVAGTAVELQGLTISVNDRVLLDGASARFEPGNVTLIVGCSGVGKSLLLQAIAGLLDRSNREVCVSGRILLHDEDVVRSRRNHSVGVIFQSGALFDELSPIDNVRFAREHRPRSRSRAGETTTPAALLKELNVPPEVRTTALSGGQQQRLAVARTLAFNPEVILYDEPTSGLDVATSGQVAALIQRTHANHPQTSIIVTHDYQTLPRIADEIYLLDADTKSLRWIDQDSWHRLGEFLNQPALAQQRLKPEGPGKRATDWIKQGCEQIGGFLVGTSRAFEETLLFPIRLLPLWKSPKWGLRYMLHYLNLVAGVSAWVYIAIAGLIIGFVATHFTFRFLPYANYTEPLLIEDLLTSMGFALYRILVPILATILIAARCGAAVASDVGGKTYGRQMDALRSLGANPKQYLLTGILYAFLLGTPLLVGIGFLTAKITSLIVFTATHPHYGPSFWQLHFHRELLVPGSSVYHGTAWLLAKVLVCAAGIASIAYHRGAQPKQSSRDVSTGITSAILWSTLYVLVVHFVFTFLEFD